MVVCATGQVLAYRPADLRTGVTDNLLLISIMQQTWRTSVEDQKIVQRFHWRIPSVAFVCVRMFLSCSWYEGVVQASFACDTCSPTCVIVRAYTYIYISIYITHTRMWTYMRNCTSIHICIYIYTYIYVHTCAVWLLQWIGTISPWDRWPGGLALQTCDQW